MVQIFSQHTQLSHFINKRIFNTKYNLHTHSMIIFLTLCLQYTGITFEIHKCKNSSTKFSKPSITKYNTLMYTHINTPNFPILAIGVPTRSCLQGPIYLSWGWTGECWGSHITVIDKYFFWDVMLRHRLCGSQCFTGVYYINWHGSVVHAPMKMGAIYSFKALRTTYPTTLQSIP